MMSMRIGRHPDCDIVINDLTVSRYHATFVEAQPGTYLLRDQQSSCGTFVMQAAIWARISVAEVSAADRIRLGAYETTVANLLTAASDLSHRQIQRVERNPETGEIIVKLS